jgi:hypothetical protein
MKKKQQAASFLHFWTYGYTGTNSQFNRKRTGINVNYMDKTVKPATDFSDM